MQIPDFLVEHAVTLVWGFITTSGVLGAILVYIRQGQTIDLERKKREDAERKAATDREETHATSQMVEITKRLQLELSVLQAQVETNKAYTAGLVQMLDMARADLASSNAMQAKNLAELAESKLAVLTANTHLSECTRELTELSERMEGREALVAALQTQVNRLQELARTAHPELPEA